MCSSSLAQSRADSFEAKFDGWFVREPDTKERLIFDSLILNFVVTKRGNPRAPQGGIGVGNRKRNQKGNKSAKIELCVIRRVSLIKNFPEPVLRNREGILILNKIGRTRLLLTSGSRFRMVRFQLPLR